MRILLGPCALLLIAAAACNSNNIPTHRPVGILNVKDTSDGAGGYITKPTGVFWDATNVNLPNSTAPAEACIDTVYFPPDTLPAVLPNQLDAGSPVVAASAINSVNMTPDTIPNVLITYRNHGAPLQYVPGADITFTIPGAPGGFDAAVIAGKTAKKLVIGAIATTVPALDSLHLTWVLGTPGTTAVNMDLLYTTGTSLVPTRQIICSMDDDGDFYVPAAMSAHWSASYGKWQSIFAFRYVTTFVSTASNGLLVTIAEFDTTKTSFP